MVDPGTGEILHGEISAGMGDVVVELAAAAKAPADSLVRVHTTAEAAGVVALPWWLRALHAVCG